MNNNLSIIAEKTNLSLEFVSSLCKEALDFDVMGEYVYHVDEKGVYLMDIVNAEGKYTMLPIPHKEFVEMLLKRILAKFQN